MRTSNTRRPRENCEQAYALDRNNQPVRDLLMKVRDKFNYRQDRIGAAMQNVAETRRVEVQAALVELDNRIDRAKRLMQQSKDESSLGTAEKIIKLTNAMSEFEKAIEIIKYLPVEANTSEQRK